MPFSKKKGSKKKMKSFAKGKQTAAPDGGGAELPPKRHTDEELFGLGHESYLGECSICMLQLSLDESQHCYKACCTKRICHGCSLASQLADKKAGREYACAFCRVLTPGEGPSGNEKRMSQIQERVEAGDAQAHNLLGQCHVHGQLGLPKNVAKGMKLWNQAAKRGSFDAHYNLAILYDNGDWGVKKDKEKMLYHYEVAAIGGHFSARHNLGCFEGREEKVSRALRHFMISAKMRQESSLKLILEMLTVGCATKDDYAQALLGYQNATEEMRSAKRDEAKAYFAQHTKTNWA